MVTFAADIAGNHRAGDMHLASGNDAPITRGDLYAGRGCGSTASSARSNRSSSLASPSSRAQQLLELDACRGLGILIVRRGGQVSQRLRPGGTGLRGGLQRGTAAPRPGCGRAPSLAASNAG